MFTETERLSLTKYAYSTPRIELEDFLYDDEIAVIRESGTRAYNLHQRIFIPKHSGLSMTIRIQHLCLDLDVEKWLLGIADCLSYGKLFTVNVGFSYIVWKPKNELRYVYAAKALSLNRSKITQKSHFHDFALGFRKLNNSDYLRNTFMSQLKGNVFESSGFTPHTLVCSYCWIEK